jgi:hypothetical protein
MIPDRPILWRQLDGPQISAVFDAIWQYWRDEVEFYQGIFQSLNIDIIPAGFLDMIGTLAGLPRPMLVGEMPPPGSWKFSNYPPLENVETGYDGLNADGTPENWGGRLNVTGTLIFALSDDFYRAVLKVLMQEEAALGSLMFWDSVCATFLTAREYKIRWGTGVDAFPDDIRIEVDVRSDYEIVMALRSIAEQVVPERVEIVTVRLIPDAT